MNCQGRAKFSASVFTLVIDSLLAELDRRYRSYQDVQKCFFGVFLNTFTSAKEIDDETAGKIFQVVGSGGSFVE